MNPSPSGSGRWAKAFRILGIDRLPQINMRFPYSINYSTFENCVNHIK